MKNIYVDTGELSGNLLNRTIEKLEVAQKKMGYNYSADAFLEVAISMAKYNSPTGRQSLFNAHFAELTGSLYGDIEDALKKLSDLKNILQKQPEELCEIDERQKGEISNFWWRASYYLDEPSVFFATIFGFGAVDPNCNIVILTEEEKDEIIEKHQLAKYVLTQEQLDDIKKSSNSASELNEKLNVAVQENYSVPVRPYSEGVAQGTIRYCNQNPRYYSENGWREGDKTSCGWMCNRGCESMALSYIGIDQPPSSMHDSESLRKLEFALGIHDGYQSPLTAVDGSEAKVQANGKYGFNRNYLDGLVNRFDADNGAGIFSPVLIRYTNDDDAHWILLIGNNENGSYQAIGPWSSPGGTNEMKEFTVNISDNGTVSGSGFSHSNKNCKVQYMCQYTRADMISQ